MESGYYDMDSHLPYHYYFVCRIWSTFFINKPVAPAHIGYYHCSSAVNGFFNFTQPTKGNGKMVAEVTSTTLIKKGCDFNRTPFLL